MTLRTSPSSDGAVDGIAEARNLITLIGTRDEHRGEAWLEVAINDLSGCIPLDALDIGNYLIRDHPILWADGVGDCCDETTGRDQPPRVNAGCIGSPWLLGVPGIFAPTRCRYWLVLAIANNVALGGNGRAFAFPIWIRDTPRAPRSMWSGRLCALSPGNP